jgi:hypothetical protein
MRFLRGVTVALVVVLTTAAAAAAVVDRIQVGVPGVAATRGFAPSLAISLTAPPSFVRGCCYDDASGAWAGPRYEATGNPSRGGPSRIEWVVSYERRAAAPLSIARRAAWRRGAEVASGRLRIPHIVAGRRVGFVPGVFLVEAEPPPSARHLAVVVVEFGRRLHGVTVYDLSAPASNSAGRDGEFKVAGELGSRWNRGQALAVVRRVAIVGDLPPRRVSVSVTGADVKGTVRDDFRHPVSEAPIRLMRRVGATWRVAGKATTSTSGRYHFRMPTRGRHRVVASLAGSSASSAVLTYRG